ncbi:MAG TPA: hypothetical protein VHM30_19875 [Gemmatimonadaceae bacterium]|nr:hypothetical protein [Gemmatimonadaceae bacterium]
MTRSLRLPLLATLALTAACTYVRATPLGAANYPAVSPDSVRLFATNPPAKYVELAMLRVEGIFSNDSRSAKALREKAAKLGANGVILLNARAVSTHGGPDIGVILGGGQNNGTAVILGDEDHVVKEFERAVAIRYEPVPSVAQGSSGGTPR